MPRQPAGLATLRGHHVDSLVSGILPEKRNPFPIRRKNRVVLMAAGGELPRVSSLARHAPQVAAVGKNHLRLAQGGRVRQQRRFFRTLRYPAASQRQQSTAQNRPSNSHVSSNK